MSPESWCNVTGFSIAPSMSNLLTFNYLSFHLPERLFIPSIGFLFPTYLADFLTLHLLLAYLSITPLSHILVSL